MADAQAGNPAHVLIDHALALRWEDIPATARDKALIFLHDSLAVGVAGRNAPHADGVLAMVRGWGEGEAAGVLGRPGVRLPAPSAAFVNAFQIHGQEYDCVHEPAVLHPMATVLAALLAEAERGDPVSGEQFLTAMVAGVDVAVTLGIAAPDALMFFRPATAGIFGCVAAIASLRAMPRDVALDAFGHAMAFASGTMQAHLEGKPALPVQVAHAARSSLDAVDLARAGMPGVAHPLDGPFGYFALMEKREELAAALARLEQGHRITEVSWKPFPTGRAGHGGIVSVQRLMALHGLTADRLDSLEYHAPPLIHRLVGRPAKPGMEPGYARLCLPFLAAVTLLRGTVSLGDFKRGTLDDPAVLALAARIRVVADGNPDLAAFVPARAAARTVDGRELVEDVLAQFGSPEWPLSEAEHLAKARGCLAFAQMEDGHAALADTIAQLPKAADAVAMLRSSGVIG
ncbi:2-methylcitrate dehydratase [Novosphingobium barchaimii LL02]|uniref:2-methylcitrate dehydratase n=1 Tax=Novosphingobium barchaimii LL02 TaxID=1114963 RepID=A0A0J7XY99_9SPHN|nr:MmgE/PrpD family protein [Novosphingobium barchaimii]KMS56487.1 2-methylcitrate dehydratase [Novosphingobium barchaimii LL02]